MTPASAPQAPETPTPPPTQKPASSGVSGGISGLRHQLRSQRQGRSSPGASTKKAKAASAKPESVLERVAQKHAGAPQMSPAAHMARNESANNASLEKPEPYQWTPSQPVVDEQKPELKPTQLKKALEHEKTPEMVDKLVNESLERSEWAKLISQLNTAKLTEQLALNSDYVKDGLSIQLTLRPQQAHLNTDKAQSELLSELNRVLGEECQLSVEIGDKGETPLELRDKLYQGKLEQAFSSLAADEYVQFIEQRFGAELDSDSVRPI